jgi:hypothetical protein
MASIPAQEEFLAVTRKSQEAMITAIKTWVETVRTATPRFMSLPSVTVPLVDKLPTPKDTVANAYDLAELLLASQRKFAEDLLKAMTPLIPDRSQSAPKSVSQNAAQAPSQSAAQAPSQSAPRVPAAGSEPKATASPARKRTPVSPAPKGSSAKNAPAKNAPAKNAPPEGTTAS